MATGFVHLVSNLEPSRQLPDADEGDCSRRSGGELAPRLNLPGQVFDIVERAVRYAQRDVEAMVGECFGGAVIPSSLDPNRTDAARARAGPRATGASTIWELMCGGPAIVASARYAARTRRPAHLSLDDVTLDRIRRAAPLVVPLGLGPVIRVDSSKPVDVAPIVARLTALPPDH
jgi:hypothetical protein